MARSVSVVGLTILLSATTSLMECRPSPSVTLSPETLKEVRELLGRPRVAKPSADTSLVFRDGAGNMNTATSGIVFEDNHNSIELKLRQSSTSPTRKCTNPKQRYHKETGTCVTVGSAGGPCGDNMIFYANDEDKIYGTCDCSENSDVPLVFHLGTLKCYPIYQRAYCPASQWLVFDSDQNPACVARKCPSGKVPFRDRCVELDTEDQACGKFERVTFPSGALEPACGDTLISDFSSLSGPKLRCRPGSSKDVVGKCRQNIKFNLNG